MDHHGVAAEARPTRPPQKRGAFPLCKILATAWSPRHLKCFMLTRRGRRGTPYSPPRKRGGFPFVQNLSNCLESQTSKVFYLDTV